MLTKFYLIRHSEKMHLPNDPMGHYLTTRVQPLTVNGERKARGLLEMKELRNADAAYSSPYARSISTLRYILEEDGLRLHLDDRLREMEFGLMPDMPKPGEEPDFKPGSKPEMPRQNPDGSMSFRARQWEERSLAAENGESLDQVADRMEEVLREIACRHPGERILIGSHGAALCALMSRYIEGIGDEYTGHLPQPAVFYTEIDTETGAFVDACRLELPPAACD